MSKTKPSEESIIRSNVQKEALKESNFELLSSPQVQAQNSHYLSYLLDVDTDTNLPVEVDADVGPHVLGTDG